MSEAKKNFERLPKTVLPSHYDIWLKPNLTEFTFQGKLTVHLQVTGIDLQIVETRLKVLAVKSLSFKFMILQ